MSLSVLVNAPGWPYGFVVFPEPWSDGEMAGLLDDLGSRTNRDWVQQVWEGYKRLPPVGGFAMVLPHPHHWFVAVNRPPPGRATVAHELVHVAEGLLRSRGIHATNETEEMRASLIGALFEAFEKGLPDDIPTQYIVETVTRFVQYNSYENDKCVDELARLAD